MDNEIIRVTSLIVIFFNILLGLFVLFQNPKSINNRLFSILCFIAAVWSLSNHLTVFSGSLLWLKHAYFLGLVVIATGWLWISVLINKKIILKQIIGAYLIPLFASFYVYSPYFVSSYFSIYSQTILKGNAGMGFWVYSVCYAYFGLKILYSLYTYRNKLSELEAKKQINIIFYGCIISIVGSAIISMIMPLFSYFMFASFDSILFLIFLIYITYAISKHNLFQIKVIIFHLLILALWVLMFLNVIASKNQRTFILELSLFSVVFFMSIIFMRGLLNNIQQREQIALLTKRLRESYKLLEEQTSDHL